MATPLRLWVLPMSLKSPTATNRPLGAWARSNTPSTPLVAGLNVVGWPLLALKPLSRAVVSPFQPPWKPA